MSNVNDGIDTVTENDKGTAWADGKHTLNVGQLVMGLVFLTFVGCWALVQTDVVTGDAVRWLLPIPWVLAGAIGLIITATGSLRRKS